MLACLISKSAGSATVGDFEVGRKEDEQKIRSAIGVLPETVGMYDDLSAYKNLDYYGKLHECPREEREQRIGRFLKALGLWERKDAPVGTFSKGMRQRLAISRALIHDPAVLFLDEPTANLDPESSRAVRDFILELKRGGKTILINTHNLDEAEKICDRVGILKTKLVALGGTKELLESIWGRSTVIVVTKVDGSILSAVNSLGLGKVEVDGNRLTVEVSNPLEDNPRIVEAIVRAGGRIQGVTDLLPSLEDAYLRLVRS
jgi:ABC-2 type transport system ATP-binding protein